MKCGLDCAQSNLNAYAHSHHVTLPSENMDCDEEEVESGSYFAHTDVTVSVSTSNMTVSVFHITL